MQEVSLGPKGDVQLGLSLDTWHEMARGNFARVFAARGCWLSDAADEVAVKIRRLDRPDYNENFRKEVDFLTQVKDLEFVVPLLEVGWLRLDNPGDMPGDSKRSSAQNLRGTLLRFAVDEIPHYLQSFDEYAEQGYVPYLVLEQMPHTRNVRALLDRANKGERHLFPFEARLRAAVQALRSMARVHERNIAYLDYKSMHFFWMRDEGPLRVIDWNISQKMGGDVDIRNDLALFARGLLADWFLGRPLRSVGPTSQSALERQRSKRVFASAEAYEYLAELLEDGQNCQRGSDLIANFAKLVVDVANAQGEDRAEALADRLENYIP